MFKWFKNLFKSSPEAVKSRIDKPGYLHNLRRPDTLEVGTLHIYNNGVCVYTSESGNHYLALPTTKSTHYLIADLGAEFILSE